MNDQKTRSFVMGHGPNWDQHCRDVNDLVVARMTKEQAIAAVEALKGPAYDQCDAGFEMGLVAAIEALRGLSDEPEAATQLFIKDGDVITEAFNPSELPPGHYEIRDGRPVKVAEPPARRQYEVMTSDLFDLDDREGWPLRVTVEVVEGEPSKALEEPCTIEFHADPNRGSESISITHYNGRIRIGGHYETSQSLEEHHMPVVEFLARLGLRTVEPETGMFKEGDRVELYGLSGVILRPIEDTRRAVVKWDNNTMSEPLLSILRLAERTTL